MSRPVVPTKTPIIIGPEKLSQNVKNVKREKGSKKKPKKKKPRMLEPQPGHAGGAGPQPGHAGGAGPQPGHAGGAGPQPGHAGGAGPQPGVVKLETEIQAAKEAIRNKVRDLMHLKRIFVHGSDANDLLNFKDCSLAAKKLFNHPIFKAATSVLVDPFKGLQDVRHKVLKTQSGPNEKTLFIPNLGNGDKDSVISRITCPFKDAKIYSKCKGELIPGISQPITIGEENPVDVCIVGSIAVTTDGRRVGVGGGQSNLEFAALVSLGIVPENVPIFTVVDECQILKPDDKIFTNRDMELDRIFTNRDLIVDYIVTPRYLYKCTKPVVQRQGILWNLLTSDMLENFPSLQTIQERSSSDDVAGDR